MRKFLLMLVPSLFLACSTEGVKTNDTDVSTDVDTNRVDSSGVEDDLNMVLDSNSSEMAFDSGLKIIWEEKNENERLKFGDVIKLDFVGRTADGKIFDSSKKIKRYIPARVGWGMLIEGWDLALKEMALGEKAKVFIPSSLAYGEKGDFRKIGPNMDITLELEVKEKLVPDFDSAGIKVYIVERFLEGENPRPVKGGDKLMFDYWSFTDEGDRYDSSYEKGHSFVHFIGDKNLNFGLRKGLEQLKEGESAYIHVPAEHGFGKKGLKGMVKPNQDIMFIVTIKKVE